MKTDRERLIELIYNSGALEGDRHELEKCRQVADFFIHQGVTIPVRCSECRHFDGFHSCDCHAADEDGTPIFVREDDFCSCGERKEG